MTVGSYNRREWGEMDAAEFAKMLGVGRGKCEVCGGEDVIRPGPDGKTRICWECARNGRFKAREVPTAVTPLTIGPWPK